MVFEINGRNYKLRLSHFIYGLIIFFFSAYILLDLRYNTAFVDEAIYATVGEEVLRGIFWESALSWMGGSYLYPLVSALINRMYGLAGIRAFSFMCLLVAGVCSGEIARKLHGRSARVFAVGLFFSSAVVLNLAGMGTYDVLAVMFISLSTAASYYSRSSSGLAQKTIVILSSLLFLAAFLSKYIAIIFLPWVAFITIKKINKAALLSLLGWLAPFAIGFAVYVWFTANSLVNFFTSDSFVEIKERTFIFKEFVNTVNIFLATFLIVPFLVFRDWVKPKRVSGKSYISVILFVAGLMPPAYHLLFANYRSLWKHVVFTQFFWGPIVAGMLAAVYLKFRHFLKKREIYANASLLIYSATLAVCIFGIWINASIHWRFQRSWPSASASLEYLARVRKPTDRIFAEGSAVYKYHLFDGFENPESWTSTWYIEYQGKTGTEAMKLAIRDQAFDYIVLNGYYTRSTSEELTELANVYYEKVLTDSFKVSGEYDVSTFVWARKRD